MALHEPIDGVALRLRSVEEADAERILDLRTDKSLTRFLPPLQGTLVSQRRWIASQRSKQADYYFAIEKKSNPRAPVEGFLGLYGFQDDVVTTAEWGRWILAKSSLASVESAFLLYRFAFENLSLDRLVCHSILANEPVVSFHDRCGLKRIRVLKNEFEICEKHYDAVEHALTAAEWPAVKATMAAWVKRFAPLLAR